jgi:hypothetical protein
MLTNSFSNGAPAPPVVPVNRIFGTVFPEESAMRRNRAHEHAGEYRASSGSNVWDLSVAARDGRLFLNLNLAKRQQTVKLTEFRPGVFVTPDGRTVHFRDGSVEFGGISFVKKN